jgi:hypothetical protein
MVTIYENKPKEKFERIENPTEIYGFKTCKNFRTFVERHIKKAVSQKDIQTEAILRGILESYNHFHPIKEVEVNVESWKGKSSFEIIKGIDKLTIIKYQKEDKDSEPKEIRTIIEKSELEAVINAINELSQYREEIETQEIARKFCYFLGIEKNDNGRYLMDGNFWNNFFSWRSMHYKLTLILSALEHLNLISYKSGKTKLTGNKLSIQLIL